MNQPEYILNNGTTIETHSNLDGEQVAAILVASKHIEARRTNEQGTIIGVVGGHGGDLYWVKHEHGTAVYGFWEFELSRQGRCADCAPDYDCWMNNGSGCLKPGAPTAGAYGA